MNPIGIDLLDRGLFIDDLEMNDDGFVPVAEVEVIDQERRDGDGRQ